MSVLRPRKYELRIETLSPLHIGVGRVLRRGYDFDVRRGETWVIDPAAVAEQLYDRGDGGDFARLVQGSPAAQLLDPSDFQPGSPLFRYVLQGEPHAASTGSEVQELLKSPWDKPYIPGSSLKGALRTAFLYDAFGQLRLTVDLNQLDQRAKFAAQALESQIVAPRAPRNRRPNYDIFKALHVGDSAPVEDCRLLLANAAVYAGKESTIPIPLECIPRGVVFTSTVTIDTSLTDHYGPERLGWDRERQLKWLKGVRVCANKFSARQRVQREYAYWKGRAAFMEGFYGRLIQSMVADMEDPKASRTISYIQLGWGGGWTSKTLDTHITRDPNLLDAVIQRYRVQMDRQRTFKSGDAYPKSRRIVVNDEGAPSFPFGWLKMTWELKA